VPGTVRSSGRKEAQGDQSNRFGPLSEQGSRPALALCFGESRCRERHNSMRRDGGRLVRRGVCSARCTTRRIMTGAS